MLVVSYDTTATASMAVVLRCSFFRGGVSSGVVTQRLRCALQCHTTAAVAIEGVGDTAVVAIVAAEGAGGATRAVAGAAEAGAVRGTTEVVEVEAGIAAAAAVATAAGDGAAGTNIKVAGVVTEAAAVGGGTLREAVGGGAAGAARAAAVEAAAAEGGTSEAGADTSKAVGGAGAVKVVGARGEAVAAPGEAAAAVVGEVAPGVQGRTSRVRVAAATSAFSWPLRAAMKAHGSSRSILWFVVPQVCLRYLATGCATFTSRWTSRCRCLQAATLSVRSRGRRWEIRSLLGLGTQLCGAGTSL